MDNKGNMSTHALFSLIIVVVMIALVLTILYGWITDGSNAFTDLLNIGG